MEKQRTIEIDGFIIELVFYFDESWDTTNGQHIYYSEFILEKTSIISVINTEKNELIIEDSLINDEHWGLVDKWLENNEPY